MRAIHILAAAVAMTSIAPAAYASEQEADNKNKVICKATKMTGSRLPGPRVCMTKAEWERQHLEARKTADETVNAGPVPPKG